MIIKIISVKKTLVFIISVVCLVAFSVPLTPRSDAVTCFSQADCNNQIAHYQTLISQAKGQENTLQNQINLLNNQISVLQLQINDKQNQINGQQTQLNSLNFSITDLTGKLQTLSRETAARFQVNEAVQAGEPLAMPIIRNDSQAELISLAYQQYILHEDGLLFIQMTNTKQTLEQEQTQVTQVLNQITAEKNSLASSQTKLGYQEGALADLLSQTKDSEANYQVQLAQAKVEAQLLIEFAQARAGSGGSIIGPDVLNDGWGTYYNQRDSQWGNIFMGNSTTQVWEAGCLMTDVAMVFTHYGDSVNPGMIASNPANFYSDTAAFNIPGPYPAGHPDQDVHDPRISSLVADLAAGHTVIAGLSFNGGSESAGYYPNHWVVLRSWNGSAFVINDPWYVSAMGVPLNYSHPDIRYSDSMIIEARVYQ